jgi:hypothetical protein
LIPDFIPVIGYLDDLLIVPAGLWLAMRIAKRSGREGEHLRFLCRDGTLDRPAIPGGARHLRDGLIANAIVISNFLRSC